MSRSLTVAVLAFSLLIGGCGGPRAPSQPKQQPTSNQPVDDPADQPRDNRSQSAFVLASDREDLSQRRPRYRVTLAEIDDGLRNNSVIMIDARTPQEFARGHVRGAINMPAAKKETYLEQVARNAAREQRIIIYCGSPWCYAADNVYDYLKAQGFTNLRVYDPGWQRLSLARDLQGV